MPNLLSKLKIRRPAGRTQCKASTSHSHINFRVLHIIPMWNLKPLIQLVFISDTYQCKQQNKRYKNETCEKIWHNGCRTSFWLPKQVLQSSQSSLVRLLATALHFSKSVSVMNLWQQPTDRLTHCNHSWPQMLCKRDKFISHII